MTFSRTEAWLTLLGNETLDSDLGIFIPNQGLDKATADKFAKTNEIKTTDKDKTSTIKIQTKTQKIRKYVQLTKL